MNTQIQTHFIVLQAAALPKPAPAESTTSLVVAAAASGGGGAWKAAGESRSALDSVSRRQASFIHNIDYAMKDLADRLDGPCTYRYCTLLFGAPFV